MVIHYRRAASIDILEALTAGKKPPIKPIIPVNVRAPWMTFDVNAKLKESSENEPKFNVDIE
jgi:hypothetical protein